MERQPHTPKLCHHKGRGLAYVTLDGKPKYLGKWGAPTVQGEYDKVISTWLAIGRTLTIAPSGTDARAGDYTVARAGAAGACDHQQTRRSPAAVPAGTHIRPPGCAYRPEHHVRVDAGDRPTRAAVGGPDGRSRPGIEGDSH